MLQTVSHAKTRLSAGVDFVAVRHRSSYLFSEEAAASAKLAASGFKTQIQSETLRIGYRTEDRSPLYAEDDKVR